MVLRLATWLILRTLLFRDSNTSIRQIDEIETALAEVDIKALLSQSLDDERGKD